MIPRSWSRSRSRSKSLDSLFSESSLGAETGASGPAASSRAASRATPPIPGLYIFPGLLPENIAFEALRDIGDADHFVGGTRDQAMFFGSSLPSHLHTLLAALRDLVGPHVPREVFDQPLARQAILNLYPPGHGISPHVDLPRRYADGVVGVSLCGDCAMDLARVIHPENKSTTEAEGEKECEQYRVFLPARTVYVLMGDARWEWTHGIEGRTHDKVADEDGTEVTIQRGLRVSVTFRWMQDGAEVLS